MKINLLSKFGGFIFNDISNNAVSKGFVESLKSLKKEILPTELHLKHRIDIISF